MMLLSSWKRKSQWRQRRLAAALSRTISLRARVLFRSGSGDRSL